MRERKTIEKRNSAQFAAVCKALLDRGANVRFRAQGQSMKPNILDGDALIIASVQQKELRRGDVALTHGEDGLRAHRVCDANSGTRKVITRSDSGQENDPATPGVLGVVIAIERKGRKTSMTQPYQRLGHVFRTQIHRLKLAASLRLKRFASSSALFIVVVASGILLNPSPAAAQADLTMSQTTSVSVVDIGHQFQLYGNRHQQRAQYCSCRDASRLPADTAQYHAAEHYGRRELELLEPRRSWSHHLHLRPSVSQRC